VSDDACGIIGQWFSCGSVRVTNRNPHRLIDQ